MKYFHSNELIAEVANFEGIPYPATAQAFTDLEVLRTGAESRAKMRIEQSITQLQHLKLIHVLNHK